MALGASSAKVMIQEEEPSPFQERPNLEPESWDVGFLVPLARMCACHRFFLLVLAASSSSAPVRRPRALAQMMSMPLRCALCRIAEPLRVIRPARVSILETQIENFGKVTESETEKEREIKREKRIFLTEKQV